MKNLDFYQKAFKKYGISARGLNWNSEDSQKIRFEVLVGFLKDEISFALLAALRPAILPKVVISNSEFPPSLFAP